MERAFKIVCCNCGHIHIHRSIDEPLEECKVCKEPLSIDSSWGSHAVRIYVEDADPKLIEDFVAEIKAKSIRLRKKKKTGKKKVPRIIKKVA